MVRSFPVEPFEPLTQRYRDTPDALAFPLREPEALKLPESPLEVRSVRGDRGRSHAAAGLPCHRLDQRVLGAHAGSGRALERDEVADTERLGGSGVHG
jgi:hypothetical protein